ncbi:coiled-coil domain-containing protein 62, partial [Bombina bombina]|uniref:coiled-coil domain-containing protein 62 n=1 Tax=Bombina bombina TaxID=8345 RepID=UPI00235AF99A
YGGRGIRDSCFPGEDDRQRVLTLEQKCNRLEKELQKRNEIIRSLTKKIKVLESQQQDRRTSLESTQQQLQELSLKASEAVNHCHDLEEKNLTLNDSVLELSAHVGRLQAREQELTTLLKLKDNDIIEATNHITEFTSRFKQLEVVLRERRLGEASALKEVQDLKLRLEGLTSESDKLKDDLQQKTVENNEQREEIIRLKQESTYLQAELVFAAERERRKDQLLQLAKSKQDRTDIELQNLRQIYVKQQHDLQFLHLTLESSQDFQNHKIDEEKDDELSDGPLDIEALTPISPGQKVLIGSNQSLHFNLPIRVNTVPPMHSTIKDSKLLGRRDSSSPTVKLQRLLAESRQMVADLELNTLLPSSHSLSNTNADCSQTTEIPQKTDSSY